MLEGVVWTQVGIGSGWAVVTIGVLMIMRGTLVPKRFYDDAMKDLAEYRKADRTKDQTVAELVKQNGHMVEVGKTMESVLQALQGGRSGGSNDEELRL